MSADQIERAQRWLANGYPPIPISRHDGPTSMVRAHDGKVIKLSPGKQPHGLLWSQKATAVYGANAGKIAGWKRLKDLADYPGLGIACGHVVGADIDIRHTELVLSVEALVRERLGDTPLRRVGEAPKVLLIYRAAGDPLIKAMTDVFVKGDLKAQVEFLAAGQQVVGAGIHPATNETYTWSGETPDTVPAADLPAVTQDQIASLLIEIEELIRAADYLTKAEIEAARAPPALPSRAPVSAKGDSPFRTVNDAALAAPERWVPSLFGPGAYCDARGVWRVPSSAVGRDREEDISISPAGIVDFGEHDMGDPKRGKRTAIDLVMEHGGAADASAAARWLADQLGIEIEIRSTRKPKPEPPELEPECERWNEELHRNDHGEARDIIHNVTLILRKDGRFKGRIRFNEMLEAVEVRSPPWAHADNWRPWVDADDLFMADWCQKRHAYMKRPTCAAAVQVVARDIRHHPVRERLNSLMWDGAPRLDSWLATYLGVPSTGYTQEVGMRWLISAVARVMQPGCKADHVLILEGPQGVGKSTAALKLTIEPTWFSDEIADLGTKDAAQDLRGKWLVELGELSALNRGAIERVKAFVSRHTDHYRPSYGIRSQDFPRQCVFIGSTNADAYLGDETGARRFWPVKVGRIDIPALERDREQLWAEAVAAYRDGANWWLDKATEAAAREEQADRHIADPWADIVMDWAASKAGAVTVPGALEFALTLDASRRDQVAANRVARIFRAHAWERYRLTDDEGRRKWGYRPCPSRSEPSPTRQPPTGAGGASGAAGCPSVPVVPVGLTHTIEANSPSRGTAHQVARADARTDGTRNFALKEKTGPDWDTGTGPPWSDLDAWRARRRASATHEARIAVAITWGLAAGGKVDTSGETIRLHLPDDLPNGLARSELEQLARDVGVMPRVVFPLDLNNAPPQRGRWS